MRVSTLPSLALLVTLFVAACQRGAGTPLGVRDAAVAEAVVVDAGATPDRAHPTATVRVPPKVSALEVNLQYACALLETKRVVCWGLVNDTWSASPALVDALPASDLVHVGGTFACARAVSDQSLHCWGHDESGQRGTRKASARGYWPPVPVLDASGAPFVAKDFLVGDDHVCVLLPNGDVSCWGSSVSGQSGLKPAHDRTGNWIPVLEPRVVFRGAVRLFGGASTSCAVNVKEELWCWGDQDSGETAPADPHVPRRIKTVSSVHAMSFASGHSCLLGEDRSVYCRGWSPGGELGRYGAPLTANDGRTFPADYRRAFGKISELAKSYVSIAAARHETCAVTTTGELECVGTPDWEMMTGRARYQTPGPAYGADGMRVRAASSAWAAGTDSTSSPPVPLPDAPVATERDVKEITAVSSTMGHRCMIDRAGALWCVGRPFAEPYSMKNQPRGPRAALVPIPLEHR